MQSGITAKNNKQGIAMFVVVLVMVMVGLSALTYFGMMREAKFSAHRFYSAEVARQIAAAAADEAFMYVHNEAGNTSGEFYKCLIERSSNMDLSDKELSSRLSVGFEIPVTLTEATLPDNLTLEVFARIIDFRKQDSGGNEYYGQEGVGTLEIAVNVKPKDKDSKYHNGTCTLVRHHDYKCALIIPDKKSVSNAKKYVSAYALGYVLFLRDGANEFEATNGASLNPGNGIKVEIEQDNPQGGSDDYGKVFLGSLPSNKVNSSNTPIFLNISESNKDLLPKETEKVLFDVDESTVNSIMPQYASSFKENLANYAEKQGADSASGEMHDYLGRFSYARLPIADDSLVPTLRDYRTITEFVSSFGGNSSGNRYYSDGIGLIISPKDKLGEIILGDVRQRFFHFGRFYVDLSKAYADMKVIFEGENKTPDLIKMSDDQETINKSSQSFMPVFKSEKWKKFQENTGMNKQIFNYEPLDGKLKEFPEAESSINIDYPYRKGLNNEDTQRYSNIEEPKFYKHRNPYGSPYASNDPREAVAPFSHVNLWARRDMTNKLLAETGIYRNNFLKLQGIIEMAEELVLGENGDVQFEGCGVIIAPSIVIKAGLKPVEGSGPKDVNACILSSRGGNITVNTDKPIEAALIAMASNANYADNVKCCVIANEALNLNGCLIADQLQANRWKQNTTHKIKYNPIFKSEKDIYQVSLSRWITFERIIEQEEQ